MTDCKTCTVEDTNPINRVGDCVDQVAPNPGATGPCVQTFDGKLCPPQPNCSPWEISDGPEDCIISDYIEEQLNIAGTTLKVHKLLGVHEQGLLQDVTGIGMAISSGDLPNNPASNAFDKFATEWKSLQHGSAVTQSAFIGYDFGPIKLQNGRNRYGLNTEVMKDIAALKIMQGCDAANRATKVRVERSENGVKWYGVAVLNLQDCDGLITLNFKRTVPSRYWRLRPIAFNGGPNDHWVVRALQFMEYEATHISNIQDKILLENRDRDYQETAVIIKAAYTPQENSTQFDRFGFNPLGDSYHFDVSFTQCIQRLGRPIVIGDIIVATSETQYSASLRPIEKYLEVTDVFWAATGFTPLWKPTVQKIVAKPLLASQETRDIAGKLTVDVDSSGLFDINDGNEGKKYQDYMDVNDSIRADHKKKVPVKGIDYADVPIISDELRDYAKNRPEMNVDKLSRERLPNGVDAMPPNGLPYTEGDEFPPNPKNGDYHRLTYVKVSPNIPARLYRYSVAKGRWIYLETDRKAFINDHRPLLDEYTDRDSTKTPLTEIMNEVAKKS